MKKKTVRYYRWWKFDKDNDLVEVTKDYFHEDDGYINEMHGWEKFETDYVDIEIKEEKKNGKKS